MAVNSSTNALYTWESFKGDLSLYDHNGKYSLHFYKTKDNNNSIEIPLKNVSGISFEKLPSKVDEFCQNYFFKVKKNGDELSIIFFEADVRDNFSPSKNTGDVPKGMGGVNFEFNKLEKKVAVQFSDKAPSYRRVCRGLNFEGKCMEKTCAAFDKYVIIPKGLGTFNIAMEQDQSQCPACEKDIPFKKVNNLGFWNCDFTVDGKQTAPEEKKIDRKDKAEKEYYTTFKTGDDCTYSYLQVTTSKQEGESGGSLCTLL